MKAPIPLSVLITGAAGEIGTTLREGLAGRYSRMVLFDRHQLTPKYPNEEVFVGDLANTEVLEDAMRGVDCVVHLAGVPREAEWAPILEANIIGYYNTIETARVSGVRRFVFASSNHVVGYYRKERVLDEQVPVRPDGRYGVSKAFGEALGRMYADKFGMSVVCLRIGSFRQRPQLERELGTWISHRDTVDLFARTIESASSLHFEIFYGVSNNSERRWTDTACEQISFVPKDAAERVGLPDGPADEVNPNDPATMFHGGPVCAREFTGDVGAID